jgi:hypothetical protein
LHFAKTFRVLGVQLKYLMVLHYQLGVLLLNKVNQSLHLDALCIFVV